MGAELRALTATDFDAVSALGRRIWLEHYVPIIGEAQVNYMLGMRFTPENLQRYIDAQDRWFEVLWADGERIGYCSYALVSSPRELKFEQLYLLPELHGRGFGGLMIRHVERRARELDCDSITLTVNKQNLGSIAVYRKAGFVVREAAIFDIGQDYVMDDYVMEKRLPSQ